MSAKPSDTPYPMPQPNGMQPRTETVNCPRCGFTGSQEGPHVCYQMVRMDYIDAMQRELAAAREPVTDAEVTAALAYLRGSDIDYERIQIANLIERLARSQQFTASVNQCLGSELFDKDERIAALEGAAAFGIAVMEDYQESLSDLDGAWVQETAVKLGVLETVEVTEPCGEECRCAEYGDFPTDCYRYTDRFKQARAALGQEPRE